ncbi:EAL domain-containing protein [Stenotrophomonas sp. SY1]|uniref:EAL domain-containing protein n=1 Tax=Stenotrophomonas sp. SY1 TaxID=477235 RepID=UPI001E2C4501|nr:EAL domain-containing protein [Stenotrophomonas sp. SY1]MCD9085149.1 EAL domain-containing protein [Stenotrophomonas sp. SY1]
MKQRHRIAALFMLAGLLLASLPVFYAMQQARKQAVWEKYQALDEIAFGLDRRVRSAAVMLPVMHEKARGSGNPPCSPAGVLHLQNIAATTQISIAALYVEEHRVVCSSSDPLLRQLVLGAPSAARADGTRLYANVRLPSEPHRRYAVLAKDGYALLLYPDGLIAPFVRPDLTLGLFNPRTGRYSARHGQLPEHWTSPTNATARTAHFVDAQAGYLVVRHVMGPANTGVIVATPLSNIDQRMAQFARWFIPAGLVAGLIVLVTVLLFTRHQFSTRSQLLRALNRSQFFLMYQPLFDLRDGTCIGAEALLRWRYDDDTVLLPDLFIPVAEDAGLIQSITQRVLQLVEKDMTPFLRQVPSFRLAVNLAASDLQSTRTAPLLAAMQQSIGVGCGQFVVEATERGLLEATSALSVVDAIRKLGIEIAIDDFGTGYSSLSYLTTYPFDILKVDKSFTSTACTQAVTSQVADHILDLARTLGMQTLVEGIETREQADFFRSRGVIYGQGYLLGRPMLPEELFRFVADNNRPGQHETARDNVRTSSVVQRVTVTHPRSVPG